MAKEEGGPTGRCPLGKLPPPLGVALHKGQHVGIHHHLFHWLLFITNVFINT
jgi:hypothetical protein